MHIVNEARVAAQHSLQSAHTHLHEEVGVLVVAPINVPRAGVQDRCPFREEEVLHAVGDEAVRETRHLLVEGARVVEYDVVV